jgi:hypothetical protein
LNEGCNPGAMYHDREGDEDDCRTGLAHESHYKSQATCLLIN